MFAGRSRALRDYIEAFDTPVFALHRPWWNVLSGGNGHVGSMGLHDVRPGEREAIQRELRGLLSGGSVGWVWLEGDPPRWMAPTLFRHYRVKQRLEGAERVRPMSGYMSDAGMVTPYRRDQLLYARDSPHGGKSAP